jgi:uncharacterized protein involved in exopolysaccharide biosynthesis
LIAARWETQTKVDDAENYLDIRDIARLFWSGRYVICASAILMMGIAALIAIGQPNVYTTETLLRPTEDEVGADRSLGVTAALGAIAGFQSGDVRSRAEFAIAILESRQFLTSFARRHQIVPELIAAESWDKKTQQIGYDEDLYLPEARKWVRKVDLPLTPEPNDTEIYEAFREILDIERNPETGFVRVKLTFVSPVLASTWIRQLLFDANDAVRQRSIQELDRSISYLREKIEESAIADVTTSIGQLLQQQLRDRMLAESRTEYALETIDPAYVPDFKSGPPRMLMTLVGGVLGGIIGVLGVLLFFGLRPTSSEGPEPQRSQYPPDETA